MFRPLSWLTPKALRRSGLTLLVLLVLSSIPMLLSTGCLASFGQRPDPARMATLAKEATYKEGHFENKEPQENFGPSASVMKDFFFKKGQRRPPGPLPLHNPLPHWSKAPETGLRITWLGHSTMLVELDGLRVLTDPIWSERASPSTVMGPKRFHPPPVKLADLPRLDAVIISHDHYDHLDMQTIQDLAKTKVPFFVPLGVASHMESWGIPKSQITELDWWGEATLADGALTLVATPSRHFSGRSLSDRNCTLWASWVIRSGKHRVYFSGDTGLTPQFETIAQRQGPFDVVMLEVGAYHPSWGDIHLGPDNAVRAFKMLGGGRLVPIHWGTFDLGIHDWNEPGERLLELAQEQKFHLVTPRLGLPLELGEPRPADAWWHEVQDVPKSALSSVPTF